MTRRTPRSAGILCFFICSLVLAASAASAAPGAKRVELPAAAAAGEWAISSRTGGVAVIETGTNSVVLYPSLAAKGTLEQPRRQPVGAEPVSLAYKPLKDGGYFLVACRGDRTIHVLDESALKVAKVIEPVAGVTGLMMVAAASSPQSPHAYYAANANTSSGQGAVGRIDVVKLANEGLLDMASGDRFELAVSADGSMLYTRRPGTSPMGFFAWRVLPPEGSGPVRASQVFYDHSTRPRYVPDPFAQSVACGATLYTPDLKGVLAELPAVPVAFLRQRPVFFGVAGDDLVAMSYNTFKAIGQRAPLTTASGDGEPPERGADGAPAKGQRRQPPPRPQPQYQGAGPPWDVLVDEEHQALLVRNREQPRHVTVLPLASFGLPDEPFLYADVEAANEAIVGQPWSAKLVKRTAAGVTLELAAAKAAVKLEGDQLRWTPGDEDVGRATVSLRLTSGALERIQRIELVVRRPGLALPFIPRQVHVTPDGRRVLALCEHRDPAARGQRVRESAPGEAPTRAVLVDVAAMTVVADRVIPAAVRLEGNRDGLFTTTVDDERAYLPLQTADAMLVVSMKDLADVKRIFTPGRPTALRSAAGKLYVAINEKPTQVYALPDLEPSETISPEGRSEVRVPVWTGDHWLFNGLLYGPDLREPVMMVSPGRLRMLPPWAGAHDGDFPWSRGEPPAPMPWGVRLEGRHALVRSSGQRIGNLAGRDALLLADVPAVAIILTEQTETGRRAQVVFSDLILGELSKPFVLSDEPTLPTRSGGASNESIAMLLTPQAGGALLAVVDDRLFVLRTDAFKALKLPEPVWIEPRPRIAVQPDGVVTIAHAAHGGKAPLKFALAGEREGISIDAETGVVSIDPDKLARASLHATLSAIANDFQHDPRRRRGGGAGGETRSPEEAYTAYADAVAKLVESITGRKPAGVPVGVPVAVKAIDSEQQESRLSYVVPVDVRPQPQRQPQRPAVRKDAQEI